MTTSNTRLHFAPRDLVDEATRVCEIAYDVHETVEESASLIVPRVGVANECV